MKLISIAICIFLLTLSTSLFGQNLSIEYQVNSKAQQSSGSLLIGDSISNWIEDFTNTSGVTIEDPFLIKKHSESIIYLSTYIFTKAFYVKDSLYTMKWTLNDDTKTILQQKCHSATTLFRGRLYTAYYSPEISNADGPWKFGGLPGLILSIASDDNMYSWTAVKIIKNYKGKVKSADIHKYKFIDWNDYVLKFIETINKWAKQTKSDGSIQPGTTVKLKIDAAEIIYPKAQQGEGISTEQ